MMEILFKIFKATGIWVYVIIKCLIWISCTFIPMINIFSNTEQGINIISVITKISLLYCSCRLVENFTRIISKNKFTFFSYFRSLYYDYRIYNLIKKRESEGIGEVLSFSQIHCGNKNKINESKISDVEFNINSEINNLFSENKYNGSEPLIEKKTIENVSVEINKDVDLSILGFDILKENYTVNEIDEKLSEIATSGQTKKLLAYISKKKVDHAIKTGDYSSFKS